MLSENNLGKQSGKEKRVNKFVLIIVTIIDLFLFFGTLEITDRVILVLLL